MFGLQELKEYLLVTDDTVECPVKGCTTIVPRQRKTFKREPEYMCPRHRIFISPSTFEYQDDSSNLLWTDSEDVDLLNKIMKVKRESRIARDNSEDAVTWNVFRFLEKNGLVLRYLEDTIGKAITNPQMVYWSYSQSQGGLWDMLRRARIEFELVPSKGSEPDLIVVDKNALFIIEAKFTATNETTPSNENVEDKLTSGGQGWWSKVFASDFKKVAIQQKLYELARFWLLGTWMASEMGLDFYLFSLVLDRRDKDIEKRFNPHIRQTNNRKFQRVTWEQMLDMVETCSVKDLSIIQNYIGNKTIGYNREQRLQRAFFV